MGTRSRSSFVAHVAFTAVLGTAFPVMLPRTALAQGEAVAEVGPQERVAASSPGERGVAEARPSEREAASSPGERGAAPAVDPQLDAEARALFLAGETAYDAGRYEAALEYFTRAYELSGRPGFLFNIASVSERLRRDEEALAAYEQYLVELPEASNRAFTEERIAFLREQLARELELREAAARAALAARPRAPGVEPGLLDEDEPPPLRPPSGRVALAEVSDLEPRAGEVATTPTTALERSTPSAPRDDGESLVEQWWFWTLVGVAVVGTGVGIGAAIAAASGGSGGAQGAPIHGDFGPGGIVVALEAF